MPLSAGTRLGPYEILSPLGAGGMGEVWKARDTRLDRIVAIKRLTPRHGERFVQEARAIAALNHPHICQIHDVGPDYLVLEYVDGRPLQGPLAVDEALRLAIQIAGALEQAHRRGILHRDLKPANIMVTASGGAKLLDFGLAKLVDTDADATLTVEGTVVGTAAYMSPEQAEGKPIDARSDIFSFGAVLYEMLSGSRAFAGQSTLKVMNAVVREEPGLLRVPAAPVEIVKRCLQKRPDQRFQTMTEVRAALELERAASASGSQPADQRPSIAVLPFANMSADPENEYFSDGLAEEIINALTHIPGLKVIARTSAFAFKGKEDDIRRIAEALGVANILEGSVRKAGKRIRVTAQLITASDGSHLWSQRYDRELADVFAVQDEISQSIVDALQVQLGGTPQTRRRHTPTIPAYEAFLKARHQLDRMTPDSLERGRELLEQAIQLDPQYALAHSYLGEYFMASTAVGQVPAHESTARAREAATRALIIDPSLREAHALLGLAAGVYDYDWSEAERRFRLAMAENPVSLRVRHWYGYFYLLPLGRANESVHQHDLALQQDPLNVLLRIGRMNSLASAGEDPTVEARQLLEISEHWMAYATLAQHSLLQGRLSEALGFAERSVLLGGWRSSHGLVAGILARTGHRERAEAMLQELGDGTTFGTPVGFATYYLSTGDIDAAANWLEKAIAQRLPIAPVMMRSPLARGLRASARWPGLARMMNLPEAIA